MVTKIPGLKGITLRQMGKYVLSRLRGVKYGAVRTENGIQLRKKTTLNRFVDRMDAQGYQYEHRQGITPEQAQEYTRKAGVTVPIDTKGQYYHAQWHGTSQILKQTEQGNEPVLDIVENLQHPTRTFLKITLYNALKNM